MEKFDAMNRLYDVYGSLLTKRQQEVFKAYYQEDLSYQEIAENLEISRTAIFDALKTVEAHLLRYEAELNILAQESSQQAFLRALKSLADPKVNEMIRHYQKGEKDE